MENNPEATSQDGGLKKNLFEGLNREELINKCKGFLVIAQRAKQAKSELQKEVENFKLQLENCETEKKRSQENVQTLQELVDSLTEQKLNYITEIDSAQTKIKTLNEKCNSFEKEIIKYKMDLATKENNAVENLQKMSDLDSEIISLKRQNKRLLEENEQLINQLTELEARTKEFNNIGLQQREQLQLLEDKIHTDDGHKRSIEVLNNQIKELEEKLQKCEVTTEIGNNITDYKSKIEELTQLYESEKTKKDKLNIKLRSYKDKILKCAACITQLKNSRHILSKTVQEYSENIPKWQNDIIKASKALDIQINELNSENKSLKEQIQQLEQNFNEVSNNSTIYHSQIKDLNNENETLKLELVNIQKQIHAEHDNELTEIKSKYQHLLDFELPAQVNENKLLKENLNQLTKKFDSLSFQNDELKNSLGNLKQENRILNVKLANKSPDNQLVENLSLQVKALESEKAILVKEKYSARDNIVDLENQNRIIMDQSEKLRLEIETLRNRLDTLSSEKLQMETKHKTEKDSEINNAKSKVMALQEQYDLLKKEHDDLQDLNGLLKEEVETLKLSLEQPKDDAENLTDLNVSLQADIVKLETKLSAYKQENSSLLIEIKESRVKMKEYDTLVAEYEDAKSKLLSYKTENTELLNEMKEINQVLKERGEAISKLQKAIAEMEKLVETLEKDRDKYNEEREEFLKRINALENDLRNFEQNSVKNIEINEKILAERDNIMKCLAEKDTIIESLKDEIEKLKQQHSSSSELQNEDNMSTSTISKAEEHARMKDLDETFEEKYSKLRIFALKLKKKLNETTTQLQNAEQDKAKLKKILNENNGLEVNKSAQVNNDELDNNKKSEIEAELEVKIKSLTGAAEASDKIAAELEKVRVELDNINQQLTNEIDAHKATKANLEQARRDAKKKNVLSLEMEDYERSMKELTTKMEENKKKMIQMESTIDTQESTITAMKTQIKLLEEQIKTEETQNRSVKEELQHVIEEGREKDNVIQLKNNIISKLEQNLEDEKRKNEEANLEMTSLLSDKEKIIMNLGEDKVELNNKLKRMEFKCAELNEKLKITNIELEDLKTEYTSYKVRAQAVLRQNQTVDHSQEEQLKEETAALKAQIEELTAKITTAQEQCMETREEAEAAKRRAGDAASEAARAQQRTARLTADLNRLSHQLDSERTQHKLQVSTLTQCYKTQIAELEAKLQKETEELKKQLVAAKENIPGESHAAPLNAANRNNQYMLPIIPKEDSSDGEMDINVSMIPREEGEGSESAPSPPLSKSYLTIAGSRRSPVPLERLLEEGVPEDEALDTASLALTPEQELADLRRKLQSQQQRVKHVTVLLSESERECARLTQLSDLLKAELRRARGAAHSAHNAEYMKNVTLKFLTLPPGDERGRLVPVLQKILTLTPEETQKIHSVAKGLDPNSSRGWGSYLSWPGGK